MISDTTTSSLLDHLDLLVCRFGVIEAILEGRGRLFGLGHLRDHTLPLSGLLGSRVVSHLFCECLSHPTVVIGTTTVVSVMLMRLRCRS